MRLRIVLSACALIGLLGVGQPSSPLTVATAASFVPASIHPVPASIKAADERMMADIEAQKAADVKAWNDGVAAGEAKKAADDQAAAEAKAARVAPAKRPAAPGTATGPSPAPASEPPAPASEPAPVPSGDAAAAVQEFFGDIFDQAWGSDHNYGVTTCESGHNPGSVSRGGGNWGLFQINTVHKADFESYTGVSWSEGILNAHYNAMYARKLFDGNGGWGPWSCRWAAYR